jgi:hypothetical protein
MPLILALSPFEAPVLADGPIPVNISIENTGTSDAVAPLGHGSSLFHYAIYDANGDALIQNASYGEAADRTSFGGDRPEPVRFTGTLPPGVTAFVEDDLAPLLAAPLPPGTYKLEASYQEPSGETTGSLPILLEIVASAPLAIAQSVQQHSGEVCLAEWHSTGQSPAVLLRQRDTRLKAFNGLSTFDPVGPIGRAALSTTVAVGLPSTWCWLGWTEGSNFVAGVATGGDFMYPVMRSPSGIDDPILLPRAYATANRGAIFSIAGDATLRLVRTPAGKDVVPEWIDVRLDEMPAGVPRVMCRWDPEKEPELHYVWTVEYKGAAMLAFAQVNPATGEGVGAVRSAYVTLRPVVAFEVPATVGPGQAVVVQVLLGPWQDEKEFAYVTFDLASPTELTSRKYPVMTVAANAFVLPHQVETAAPPILGVTPSAIWTSRGGTDEWRTIATGEIDVASVRLWAQSSRRQICTWFDRTAGYKSLTMTEHPAV